MEEAVMRKKILDLFEYRRLPALMEYGHSSVDQGFLEDLILLQWDIYNLDAVLESSWDTDRAALESSWEKIYDRLHDLGVEEEEVMDYCHEIKVYEKHELNLRDGKYPHDLDMEYFYYFKSCDVKLLRRLIYDRYPKLHDVVALEDWKVFDYITEVNDDVEDVEEDLYTINGNGFLISKLIKGHEETQHDFQQFLKKVALLNRDKSSYPEAISPYQMTLDILPETLSLLEKQAHTEVHTSLLWKKIG